MGHVVLVLVETVNDCLYLLEDQGYELILAPSAASRAEAINGAIDAPSKSEPKPTPSSPRCSTR